MANKYFKVGPQALSNTLTTNIYQGGGGSDILRDIIKHIHVINKTSSPVSLSLWIGLSGGNVAGTEFESARVIPENSVWNWYGSLPLSSLEYLVGGASAGNALSITINGVQRTDFSVAPAPSGPVTSVNGKTDTAIVLTMGDIADTLNKRVLTDAESTALGNTSGANTGDETKNSIENKMGFIPDGVGKITNNATQPVTFSDGDFWVS